MHYQYERMNDRNTTVFFRFGEVASEVQIFGLEVQIFASHYVAIIDTYIITMQQLSTPELKTREQADQYLRVEQNTEYLTHLMRYSANKRRVYLKPEVHLPDMRSIANLIVQLSYLLFTCYVKKVNLLISQRFLLANPQRRQVTPQIYCEYIMEKDYLNLREEERKIIDSYFMKHEFASEDMSTYGKYAIGYVKVMLDMAKPQFERLKIPADKMLARQLLNLQSIKNYLQARLQSIQHPRIVILSLEESQIFREYSILVKVMNNSIFSTIKNNKNKNIFGEICRLETQLLKSRDSNKSFLQGYSMEIEAAIQELLRFLIKIQIITVEQSISNMDKTQANKRPGARMQDVAKQPASSASQDSTINRQFNPTSNTKQYMLGEVEQTSVQERLYKCRIHIGEKQFRKFDEKIYDSLRFQALHDYNSSEMQDESVPAKEAKQQSQGKNEFIIEFIPAKGLLVVKYITPIELNIENTDLVMFQCNNVAYHWSSVNMELVQKSPNKLVKKKERYLSLKTIAHLNIAERPLFKLLLMLDLVMLCAKIAEPELKRSIIQQQDYTRIEQISLKVNHMINLFIRKIERYYKIIADEQSQARMK